MAWKLASLTANQALRLAALLLIARWLSPREFGLAAMALSFWALATVFTDLALGAALVQRAEIDEQDRSTAFWAGAASGLILALAGVAASGAVAAFFDESEVRWLFAALALSILLNSLASTHVALLTRAMDFRTLELVSVAATATGAALGIALAFAGAGPWALVASVITTSAVSCVLVWHRSDWRPQLLVSRSRLRGLFGFATLLSSTRLVVALHRSADRVLVGRFLGASALALYAVPSSIVHVPAARLVDPVRSVLFPALSRLQRSVPELAAAWVRVTRLTCALLAPVLLSLALGADELVELALPPRWSDAAPVLRILALAGLFQLAGSMNAVVLTALDRLSTVLRVFGLTFVLSVTGFAVGQRFGLEGAAAGYAGAAAVVAPLYVGVTARALGLRLREALAPFAAPAVGLVTMAGVVVTVNGLLLDDASALARLAALVGLGLGAYVLVVLRCSPAIRHDLRAAVARSPA